MRYCMVLILVVMVIVGCEADNPMSDDINARLDEIDGHLDNINARLDEIDGHLDNTETFKSDVDSRIDEINTRLDNINAHLDGINFFRRQLY